MVYKELLLNISEIEGYIYVWQSVIWSLLVQWMSFSWKETDKYICKEILYSFVTSWCLQ